MLELLSINAICILFDIALLVVEYQNRHVIEQAIKPVVYSIKLKLEFVVLRKLIDSSQRHARMSHDTFAASTDADFERKTSRITTAPRSGSVGWKFPKRSDRDDVVYVEKL
jgi:hypothetical protein